jgi:hypothetical protein
MTNNHLEKTVTVAPLTSHLWAIATPLTSHLWAIATQPLVWWMEGTAHKQQALVIRDILGKLLSSGSDHVLIINHEIIWIYGMVSLPIHRCSSCMNHRYSLQAWIDRQERPITGADSPQLQWPPSPLPRLRAAVSWWQGRCWWRLPPSYPLVM